MELVFKKEDMMDAMKTVSRAAGDSYIPILSNVLISTARDPLPGLLKPETDGDDGIYLAATDLEIGIRASVPGQVIEGGAVTIPARKFAAMVKEMPGSDVHLVATASDRVNIDCGPARFRLAGLPADEFPSLIPEVNPESQPELIEATENKEELSFASINAEKLAAMIQRTSAFAASKEETRYFLNGIHLSLNPCDEGGCLVTLVATDGKRLAVTKTKAEGSVEKEKGAIILIKAMEHLKSMLQGSDISDMVKISLHESRVIFDMDDTILASRLIEGEYPDYSQAIPAENNIKLTIVTQRLLSVARRVATMAYHRTPCVKIEVIADTLRMSSATPEFGEAQEEMLIKKEGDDITIGLNVLYLMDALKAIVTEEVAVEMSAPLKPVVVKPAGNDDYHLSVIMPIRI